MKNRHLSLAAALLVAVTLLLTLSACTVGEYVPTEPTADTTPTTTPTTKPADPDVKDLFPALNAETETGRDTVYLLLTNRKGNVVLNAGYYTRKADDGSYHTQYSYETLNAIAPGVTDYKTTHTGEFVTKDGKMISRDGEDCDVTLEQTARAAFTFSADNAKNIIFTTPSGIPSADLYVTADIPDADAFFGTETGFSGLSVTVTYTQKNNGIALEVIYFECTTADGWNVAGTYVFNSERLGGN